MLPRQLLIATDIENCTVLNSVDALDSSYTFVLIIFCVRIPWKLLFLYASTHSIIAENHQQINHITYIFTFRYAFNLTEIYARFCQNN